MFWGCTLRHTSAWDGRDDIQDPACKSRVLKMMEFASSDIRFDVALATACADDRYGLCGNVPAGSARVIRCLQDQCAPAPALLPRHCLRLNASSLRPS